ncbi:hypothetical protein AX14_002798 [Amanita brunnescens Koide BX004]|nr:hypothetical protein AX14_002798 [Amanita brunnescens Koide BX004]
MEGIVIHQDSPPDDMWNRLLSFGTVDREFIWLHGVGDRFYNPTSPAVGHLPPGAQRLKVADIASEPAADSALVGYWREDKEVAPRHMVIVRHPGTHELFTGPLPQEEIEWADGQRGGRH